MGRLPSRQGADADAEASGGVVDGEAIVGDFDALAGGGGAEGAHGGGEGREGLHVHGVGRDAARHQELAVEALLDRSPPPCRPRPESQSK